MKFMRSLSLLVALLILAQLNLGCPSLVSVPNLVGLTRSAAETALADAGLVTGLVTEVSDDNIPAGEVISQVPRSGVTVLAHTGVCLVVSTGPGGTTGGVPLALQQFLDSNVTPAEGADNLFSTFLASIADLGFDAAKAALDDIIAQYVANGGSLDTLRQRSLQIPAAEFDSVSVGKRQAVRAYAKAHGIKDFAAAEDAMKAAGEYPSDDAFLPANKNGSGDANRVLFVNGICTDYHDFLEDMAAISAKVDTLDPKYQAYCSGFWNPNSTMPFQLSLCTIQKIEDWVADFSTIAVDDPVKVLLQARIQSYLDAGKNVVMVPHSQGNLYTRTAVGDILAGPSLADGIGISVVETGSPAGNMPNGVRYDSRVDVAGDLVAQLSGVYSNPPYPYEGSWGWGDTLLALLGTSFGVDPNLILFLNCHSFTGAYMQGQAAVATLQHVQDYCILPPEILSFAIEGGAATAESQSVTLNSVCKNTTYHAEVPTHFMASESPTFDGAVWQPYSAAASFELSAGSETKTVYFKVKNAAGESTATSDTISLEIHSAGDEETIMLPGGVPLVMVWCPKGTFWMGRYPDELGSIATEGLRHEVTLTHGFWIGKYEFTKAQWRAVFSYEPWADDWARGLDNNNGPAVDVTWGGILSFIGLLNTATGKTFRLPTEAEWEYACRAGTTTRFYWGNDLTYSSVTAYAWAFENDDGTFTHTVGLKAANPWGLHDMSGNAWEIVRDNWTPAFAAAPVTDPLITNANSQCVIRGGAIGWTDEWVRSATRRDQLTYAPGALVGFRIAR